MLWLILVSTLLARAHEQAPLDVARLVQQFDRELETRSDAEWSLESSAAYQQLMKLRAGHHFQSASPGPPVRFEPGTGPGGQIGGGEFPRGTWAFTFDDGPHVSNTNKVLGTLRAFSIPATFFYLAENVVRLPDVVRRVEDMGFTLQNHSYTHPDLTKLKAARLKYEVETANETLNGLYRLAARFFRLPYGAGAQNARVRRRVADSGLISVLWNVDSLDWADHDPQKVADRVIKQMMKLKRGIVLFHDIQGHTADAAARVFDRIKGDGYRFVTIPEIVDELNGK